MFQSVTSTSLPSLRALTSGLELLGSLLHSSSENSTTWTLTGPENIIIIASQIKEMKLTRLTIIPAAVVLLLSSTTLCLTILLYFKRVIKLYLSLIFYALTELILFLQVLVFYLLATEDQLKQIPCGVTKSLGLFAMILPILAILLITICRLIFIKYPFHYRNILRIKYQLVCCLSAIGVALVMSLWPAMGVCRPYFHEDHNLCQLQHNSVCSVFVAVYIVLGILAPTAAVIGIYIFVYKVLRKHRARLSYRDSTSSRSLPKFASGSETSKKTNKTSDAFSTLPAITITDCSTGLTIVNNLAVTLCDGTSHKNISVRSETSVMFASETVECGVTDKDVSKKECSAFDMKHEEQKYKRGDKDTVLINLAADECLEEEETESMACKHLSSSVPRIVIQPPTTLKEVTPHPPQLHQPSLTRNFLSPHWLHTHDIKKEHTKLHEMRSGLSPYFKEAVRRLSSVTEYADLLIRKEIPWSLVLLTLIHISSSVPWILVEFYSTTFFSATAEERVWLDIGNAVLVGSVGVSPLLYITFTRLIRDKVWQVVCKGLHTVVRSVHRVDL